jgi:serine/threonine-protein kinase
MFDIGEHGGDKFLTMELVDGESLARTIGQAIAGPRLEAIAQQMCAGLAAAHAAGVVHRDLKPDNILVERDTDRIVITDFGIARGGDDPGVTQVGAIVGTPRYMAPEQLAGGDVDARADLFALGVILYELASGSRPWVGDNAISIAIAQATTAPPDLDATTTTEIPAGFAAIVAACLRIDRDHRPASATAIGDALTARDAGVLARGAPATRALRPSRPPAIALNVREAVPRAQTAPPVDAPATSLAVLPPACAPGDEYLADGMLDDLIDMLSTTPGLRVRPAGVVRAVTSPDPRTLGAQLDVDHVVVSSIRRTPGGLRVTARLIGVADGFQIWAHKKDCSDADVLAVADELGRGIASALSTRATGATRPTDPRAVDLYLRARAEMKRFWGNHMHAATQLLEQAAEYAPHSAPIRGSLAWARVQTWVMRGRGDLVAPARQAIERRCRSAAARRTSRPRSSGSTWRIRIAACASSRPRSCARRCSRRRTRWPGASSSRSTAR